MGLLDIFRSDTGLISAVVMEYKELLKTEKEKNEELQKEVARLNNEIIEILKSNLINQKEFKNVNNNLSKIPSDDLNQLTKLESKIYNFISNSSSNTSKTQLAKELNITEGSLKVYISKIRKKGFNI